MTQVLTQPVDTSVISRMSQKVKETKTQQLSPTSNDSTLEKPESKPEIKSETVKEAVSIVDNKVDEATPSNEANFLSKLNENKEKIELEKKEIVKEDKKSVPDIASEIKESVSNSKLWFEDESVEDVKPSVKDNKSDNLISKEQEYDPFIEAYISAKKAGKDITSFIKEISPLDVDSIPTERLFELSLEKEGLTDEEKLEELEQFQKLTPLQKKRAVSSFKESVKAQEMEKLSKYISDNKVDQSKQEEFLKKYQDEKSNFLSKLSDKEYMGLKLTKSDIDNAINYIENGFPTTREDGTYNIPSMFELAVFRNKKKEIMQNALNKGISMGREQVLKELSRIDKNDGAGKVLPDVTVKSKSDQAKEIMRKKFGS